MKPLGDAFIRLITMIISLIIFCTVVSGIAGMENLKKVGRVGGMALVYFEVVSTVALCDRPGRGKCGAPREWIQRKCRNARCQRSV